MNSEGEAADSFMWQEEEVVYEVYTVDPLLLVDTVTDQMKSRIVLKSRHRSKRKM